MARWSVFTLRVGRRLPRLWQIVLLPFGQFGDVEEDKGGGQGGYAGWDDR